MVLEPMMSKTVKFLAIAALCFVGFATKANAQAIGQLQAGQIWGNPTSGQALARGTLPGPVWDQAYSCGQNQVLNRGASLWACTISPVLGVAGTSVGSIGFQNATSGTETIKPATGALDSGIATLPAGTYNLAGDSLTQTLTNKTFNCANNTCTVRLGSDVTGNLPLASLATGSLDQVIGYFGATTGNAISINNCSNALTYSTSTHTFGCNVAAGTGTVTSVGLTNTYGLSISGSPVTTSGNISAGVSLTTATNTLGGDVSLSNSSNYFDGPSMAQGTSGTWFASGAVTVSSSTADSIACKLWDGTTIIASGNAGVGGSGQVLSFSGFLTNPAANIRISCKDASTTNGKIKFNLSGNSADSVINGIRIQ